MWLELGLKPGSSMGHHANEQIPSPSVLPGLPNGKLQPSKSEARDGAERTALTRVAQETPFWQCLGGNSGAGLEEPGSPY